MKIFSCLLIVANRKSQEQKRKNINKKDVIAKSLLKTFA